MKLLVTIVGAMLITIGCNTSGKESSDTEFKAASLKKASRAFQELYKHDILKLHTEVLMEKDLKSWLDKNPIKSTLLPCELEDILGKINKGNIDPSPIAIKIFGSELGDNFSAVYIPISLTNCENPKQGYFLDSKDCDEEVLACVGQNASSASCYCDCAFVCNMSPNKCSLCPDNN